MCFDKQYYKLDPHQFLPFHHLQKVPHYLNLLLQLLDLIGIPQVLNYVCQGVILVTTVYSGIEYFAKNADVFKEVK